MFRKQNLITCYSDSSTFLDVLTTLFKCFSVYRISLCDHRLYLGFSLDLKLLHNHGSFVLKGITFTLKRSKFCNIRLCFCCGSNLCKSCIDFIKSCSEIHNFLILLNNCFDMNFLFDDFCFFLILNILQCL